MAVDDAAARSAEPALRWSARAHSIAEIESELARIWAAPGPDRPRSTGEPARHVAARTSVMNLVVIARRPELGRALRRRRSRRSPAAIRRGRSSSSRPIRTARRGSTRGSRPTASCRATDAPETCAEIDPRHRGGETGRHLAAIVDAAAHPRPAGHGLVAGRAAARRAGRRATCSRRRPPGRRRLDLDRRRPRPARASWPHLADDGAARRQRLRARPPVALAGGDRLDLRRPGVPAVPALAPPDRGDLRDARRDRDAPDRPTWSSRSTTSPGWPRGWACTSSSRWPRSPGRGPAPGRARGRAPPAPARPPGAACGDAVGRRAEVAVVVRPVASPMPAGHDAAGRAARRTPRLRAPGRRHRRGRDRPRPGLAGRRRGARAALQGAAPDRGGPAGRGDRGRAARPGRGRRAPGGGGPRRAAWEPRMTDRRRASRGSSSAAAGRRRRTSPRIGSSASLGAAIDGTRASPTGRRPAARPGRRSTGDLRGTGPPRRRRLGARPRLVGRRPVRPARPPAVERRGARRDPARTAEDAGGVRVPAASTSTRSAPAEAIGDGPRRGVVRGGAGGRARGRSARRAAGGWPAFDLVFLGIGGDGHLLSVFPGSAALDAPSLGAWRSRRRPTSSRTSSGSRCTRRSSRPRATSSWSPPARRRPGSSPTSWARCATRAAGRPSSRARGRDLDPRRGGRRPAALPSIDRSGHADRPSSPDGTPIAVFRSGDRAGPPVLLVHGTTADHTTFRARRAAASARRSTSHAIDRRGRGASGDTPALRDRARVRGRRGGRRRPGRRTAARRSTSSATRTAGGRRLGAALRTDVDPPGRLLRGRPDAARRRATTRRASRTACASARRRRPRTAPSRCS